MSRKRAPGRGAMVGVLLALAVAATAGSALLLSSLLTTYRATLTELRKPPPTVTVVVASRDLYQGMVIVEEDLVEVEVPADAVPEGVFSMTEAVIGRVPRDRILADEWVRTERLANAATGAGLSAVIPAGLRTVSVELGDAAALHGLLQPGSTVDVLVTEAPEERVATGAPVRPRTRTVLQAVLVVAVDARMAHDLPEEAGARERVPSVTLLLTPDQAVAVVHATRTGKLSLTLRSDLDLDVAALGGVDVDDLRSRIVVRERVVRRPPRTPPARRCTEFALIAGARKDVVQVDENGLPCT